MTLRGFRVLGLVLAILCAACTGVGLLNATVPSSGYERVTDVAYASGARHTLDIYKPDKPLATHPVVLFMYGGSWQSGEKAQYLFVGQALASAGITTVIADYRIAPEVDYPDFLHDTAKALVWVHGNIARYGGDAGNLFIAGHSAGAYNAIMVATNDVYLKQAGGKTEWLRGAIGLAGPYNFLPMTDPKLIKIFHGANRPETQPISYVRTNLPPMLLIAGTGDTLVAPSNTTSMAKALADKGNEVSTRYYDGIGHIELVVSLARGFRHLAPTLVDMTEFVRAHSVTR